MTASIEAFMFALDLIYGTFCLLACLYLVISYAQAVSRILPS